MEFNRSFCFFDLETTGVDVKRDRIVQIGLCFCDQNLEVTEERNRLINPELPIPVEASDVHGITNEMVKDRPTFKQIAKSLYSAIKGRVMIGYNSNWFDRPLLFNEFRRAGIEPLMSDFIFIDACSIFKRKEERTLTAAMKFYCDKELEGAHDALIDVKATREVFMKQLEFYNDIGSDLEEISMYSAYDCVHLDASGFIVKNKQNEIVFGYGKHSGKKIKDVDPGYIDWIVYKSDFSTEIKNLITCHISQ